MATSVEPTRFSVRATVTDPIVFGLKEVDPDTLIETVKDITGFTEVRLALRQKDGGGTDYVKTDSDAELAVSDAAQGEVTLTPANTDFPNEEIFEGWIRVTDGAGNTISFPNGDFFEFVVLPNF